MDAVEEVKSRLSIEDVISEYVQLKRAGRNWKGLSPFSNEKTPSFVVSPEKQIWHDFSSGQGGDMFSFVMAMEGLEFKDTLELLARKAGIDLEQYRRPGQKSGPDKTRLREILELSTKFYQEYFKNSQLAQTYVFKKREFSKKTVEDWRLGYAPNIGDALVKFLKSRGINDKEIKLAGLTGRGGRDMFRQRLVVPLADGQGQILGFTARLLGEQANAPKYINTPATPLYDKSRHVFGLHHAKAAIRQAGHVILVEGNLDVVMSHQAGVKQVVATAGTALTEQHLKALSRLTGDIRLSFDADRAGVEATERAIPLASKAKVSLSIITIPSGKDPDELIKQDAAKWQEIIQKPQYALDWLIERYEKLLDLKSAEGKRKFSDKLLTVVKDLSDSVEQDHYVGVLAEKLDASKEALVAKMNQTGQAVQGRQIKRRQPHVDLPPQAELEQQRLQDRFLGLMLMRSDLRHHLELIQPDMFAEAKRPLMEFLKQTGSNSLEARQLEPWADVVKMLQLQYEELYQGLESAELGYEATRLRARLIEAYVKQQKQVLVRQMENADSNTSQQLLTKVKDLDSLLRASSQGGR